jgi:hypothetical protein
VLQGLAGSMMEREVRLIVIFCKLSRVPASDKYGSKMLGFPAESKVKKVSRSDTNFFE